MPPAAPGYSRASSARSNGGSPRLSPHGAFATQPTGLRRQASRQVDQHVHQHGQARSRQPEPRHDLQTPWNWLRHELSPRCCLRSCSSEALSSRDPLRPLPPPSSRTLRRFAGQNHAQQQHAPAESGRQPPPAAPFAPAVPKSWSHLHSMNGPRLLWRSHNRQLEGSLGMAPKVLVDLVRSMPIAPGLVSGTSRTVYLGNIPPETSAEEILGHRKKWPDRIRPAAPRQELCLHLVPGQQLGDPFPLRRNLEKVVDPRAGHQDWVGQSRRRCQRQWP